MRGGEGRGGEWREVEGREGGRNEREGRRNLSGCCCCKGKDN